MWKSYLGIGPAQPAQALPTVPPNTPSSDPIPGKADRQQTTVAIEKLVKQNYAHDVTSLCPEAARQNPGCILLQLGADPCEGGVSKLHKLHRGHHVYSETPVYCGSTCAGQPTAKLNMPLYCLLCVRDDLARQSKHPPLRWHDLLLPSYHNPVGEAADLQEYSAVTRATESAFVDSNQTVMLPRRPSIIALIWASERQREEVLAPRIINLLASNG
jgi:hypothetical protein